MLSQRKIISEATAFLTDKIRYPIGLIPDDILCDIKEFRLKRNTPISIVTSRKKIFFKYDGTVIRSAEEAGVCRAESVDIEESVRRLCNYSVHAYQNEMINGYITLAGGHRVGICATAVVGAKGNVSAIRNVSSINIRIARQIEGAANQLAKEVFSDKIRSVLIVGEPISGKTTILRDTARILSGKEFGYMRVCVVDERGEIAATSEGISKMNVGIGCDVLDGYPKSEGMLIALRALSPDVIICDEIGSDNDVKAIENIANAGVKLIASIHSDNMSKLIKRPQFIRLMQTSAFDVAVVLDGKENPGKIKEIISLKRFWR